MADEQEATNYPIEFLNSLNMPVLPSHEICLKIGIPIILLRNLRPPQICNGTRLKVTQLQQNVIEAQILIGCGAGETIFIPRIPIIPNNFPFQFKRTQFPVSVCYAMTINKAQGQTFRVVGVDLGNFTYRMKVSNYILTGNSLKVTLIVSNEATYAHKEWATGEFKINAVAFQVKVIALLSEHMNANIYKNLIFVRFVKLYEDDDLIYIIKVTSKHDDDMMSITDKNFISDDGTWHLLQDNVKWKNYCFIVTGHIDIVTSSCPLTLLHDDTELTDFELKGEDGSIRMHRAVLAAASPVLKAMLSGKWRETTDGKIDKLNTSKAALQYFKDYLYLGTLPKAVLDLKQLLLLASYYMIKDLEQKCVFKLVSMITAENTCDLFEFAGQHKVKRLQLAILQCVKGGGVEVDKIRYLTLHSEASEDESQPANNTSN
ncbi:hypothetical protein evm_002645 [Chilo suppressalis]|nr:hypothetical protein evm_002645 [Chilo suppressalis]